MHFDVIFGGSNKKTYETNLSYGLVFIPTPAWVKGDKIIKTFSTKPKSSNPKYRMGSIKLLIKSENLSKYLIGDRKATVIIRHIGHGTKIDLNTLKKDLINENFEIKIYNQKL